MDCYTGQYLFLSLMIETSFYFKDVQQVNIILLISGPIPVVPILYRERLLLLPHNVDLVRRWGFVAALTEVFTFSYQADVGSGLIENEFDHVFFGVSNQNPDPNPAEVSDWDWVTIENLEQELIRNPKEL